MKIHLKESIQISFAEVIPKNLGASNNIHIWLLDVNDFSEDYYQSLFQLLSETEVQKANRFHFEKDKKLYVFGKAVTKILAGKYLNTENDKIEFGAGKFKKPFIKGFHNQLQFNISHSGTKLLIAFRFGSLAIGVDIEKMNLAFDFQSIVDNYFSKNEQALITEPKKFYEFWTRKEALLKVTGVGLINQLQKVEVAESGSINLTEESMKAFDQKSYFFKSFFLEEYACCVGLEAEANAALSFFQFKGTDIPQF